MPNCPTTKARALLNAFLDHLLLLHEIRFANNDILSPITGEVLCTWPQVYTAPLATLEHLADLIERNRTLPSYRTALLQRQPWYSTMLQPIEQAVARNLARANKLPIDIDPVANACGGTINTIQIHTARFN